MTDDGNGQNQNDSIIDKVRKLIALAGNNSNEHEAAAAMARAQELLAKYNLSMAQVDHARTKTNGNQPDAAPRQKTKVERSAMFQWQRDLWNHLAHTNFCLYWTIKVTTRSGIYKTHHHYIVGREDNVAVVQLMGEYLEDWVTRNCPYKVGKDVHLWKLGAVERINKRLLAKMDEMMAKEREAQEAGSQTTAVALRDVYDIERHANYLTQYGNSDYCPCKRCYAERDRRYKEELAKRPLPEVRQEPKREPTEAERRANERRWRKANEEWEEKQRMRRSEAFRQGVADGDKVNLDTQIKAGGE